MWRHGIGVIELTPSDNEEAEVIAVSPLMLEPYNMDFDGDTGALYLIHGKDALQEMNDKAFIQNTITYDVNNDMLAVVRHEALYGAYILTEHTEPTPNIEPYHINSLDLLEENDELYNNHLRYPIQIGEDPTPYCYGIALLNKWCKFDKIYINKSIVKKQSQIISKMIYAFHKDNKKYYDVLTELNTKLLYFISTTVHCPSLNIEEMVNVKNDEINELFKKLPNKNVYLGYIVNEALIDKCLERFDGDNSLYKLYKSGSRFSRQQLARSCINIGYSADAENVVLQKPIKSDLMTGLTAEDFFRGSPGSRKGISDKAKHTPQSGYMERTLTMALSPLEIAEDDCGSYGLEINIFNLKHAETLVGKYYKDAHNPSIDWQVLDLNTAKKYINNRILIRSPMTCTTPNFKICRKCFGTKELPTKYLGIVAAQSLAERFTQAIMRSFHTSGSATLDNGSDFVRGFIKDHIIDIHNNATGCILEFNQEVPVELNSIPGFNKIEGNKVYYNNIDDEIKNKDIVSAMNTVQNLLKSQANITETPAKYYEDMMSSIIEFSTPYSSFVEMLFANMFVCNPEETEFWRYNQDKPIFKKLGDKMMANKISTLLGLLYQPNKKTLEGISTLSEFEIDVEKLNIYERIWLGLFT